MSNNIKMTSAIEQIPFADLYVSELNPRSVADDAGIATLAQNIREVGLIQNLAGLRDAKGNKIGIVAGGRRLRALALLQDHAQFMYVPVQIAPDEATARDWAAAENQNREAPHPADEIAEFGKMRSEHGIKVPANLIAFGVTEAYVYRRLALADLPAPVLDALKEGSFTLAKAIAFTVSNDEKFSLEVLERVRGDSHIEARNKKMLKPTSLRSTDRRAIYVGEDAYKTAGGLLTTDLFSEESLFDSVEILDVCFAIRLKNNADSIRTEQNWQWVDYTSEPYLGYSYFEENKLERIYPVEGELSDDQYARYDELTELGDDDMLDEKGTKELSALQDIL
jgi:ParB family chromosome partitioning protein